MIDGWLPALRVSITVMCFFGLFALEACKPNMRPDQVLYACFDRTDGPEKALRRLREVSDLSNYRLREYGEQAKSDLKAIDANPATIPEGKPIQADIRNLNNDVVAIASNFGNAGEGLRISFFRIHKDNQDSLFRQAAISSLESVEGVHIKPSAVEDGTSPCGKF